MRLRMSRDQPRWADGAGAVSSDRETMARHAAQAWWGLSRGQSEPWTANVEMAKRRLDRQVAAGFEIGLRVHDDTCCGGSGETFCLYCKGTLWIEDEGWSAYPVGDGRLPRSEWDGLLPCGACNDDRADLREETPMPCPGRLIRWENTQ